MVITDYLLDLYTAGMLSNAVCNNNFCAAKFEFDRHDKIMKRTKLVYNNNY